MGCYNAIHIIKEAICNKWFKRLATKRSRKNYHYFIFNNITAKLTSGYVYRPNSKKKHAKLDIVRFSSRYIIEKFSKMTEVDSSDKGIVNQAKKELTKYLLKD